jgi:hypothetical protein
MAKRKKKSVVITAAGIVINDDGPVVLIRSRPSRWHHGERLKRTTIGRSKSIILKPNGGIVIGSKLPGPK